MPRSKHHIIDEGTLKAAYKNCLKGADFTQPVNLESGSDLKRSQTDKLGKSVGAAIKIVSAKLSTCFKVLKYKLVYRIV